MLAITLLKDLWRATRWGLTHGPLSEQHCVYCDHQFERGDWVTFHDSGPGHLHHQVGGSWLCWRVFK